MMLGFVALTPTYVGWLGDYDTNGTAIQQAIWLDDMPVGLMVGANAQVRYVEPDHLGTPRVVVDPTRNVAVWAWDLKSEAFGNSPPHQDPDGDGVAFVLDMRFPGQRYDAASGLNYNYARDYEPGTGRYVQSDPIGLSGGISTYAYADSMPVLLTDRFGLDATCSNCAPNKRRFRTIREAARTVLAATWRISRRTNIEVCGLVCKDDSSGEYFLADATPGTGTGCLPFYRSCPSCSSTAGWWHTHGAPDGMFSNIFSPDDQRISDDEGIPGFLGTPSGIFKSYTPGSGFTIWGPL